MKNTVQDHSKMPLLKNFLLCTAVFSSAALSSYPTSAATTTIDSNSSNTVKLSKSDDLAVTNNATLSTGGDKAVSLSNPANIAITVDSGSTILSADDTIHSKDVTDVTGSIVVNNNGTIRSTGGGQSIDLNGVSSPAVQTTINNNSTGKLISDDADGIRPGANATVNNSGEIHADGPVGESHDGIDFQEYAGTVNNASGGLISGERHGITSDIDVNVVNDAGATIIGRNGSGVGSDGTGSVINHGTIIGAYDGSGTGDGDGVDIDNDSTIENWGTIKGTGAAGVDKDGNPNAADGIAASGGTVNIINHMSGNVYGQYNAITMGAFNQNNVSNEGTIEGDLGAGISGTGPFYITNSGTIKSNYDGIQNWNGSSSITNSGTISGTHYAIMGGNGDLDITNTGTISAEDTAIFKNYYGNSIVIHNDGTISGGKTALHLTGNTNDLFIEKNSLIFGIVEATFGYSTIHLEEGSTFVSATGFNAIIVDGKSTITGNNTVDTITINGNGRLQLGNGSASGMISGQVMNNGALAFDRSDNIEFSPNISGSGSVIKDGTGNVTLANANTYTGGTQINAGTLTGTATSFGIGAITDNAALVLNQNSDATFANTVSGTGALTKNGTGNLTLADANTYSGGTRINAGSLTGTATSFGTGAITNNAALVLNQISDATLANTVGGTGTLTKNGTGNLTLADANTYSGETQVNAGTLTGTATSFGTGTITNNATLVLNQISDATLANTVSGTGTLVKDGNGTATLSARNTYSGGTQINAGTLIGTSSSFGTPMSFGTGNITNNAALVLNLSTDNNLDNLVTGTGTFTKDGTGNLTLVNANTYSGGTQVNAGTLTGTTTSFGTGTITNNAALVLNQNSNATLANTVVGTGTFTKTGTGNLTLADANTYSGGTRINAGTLTGTATSFGTGAITNNATLVVNQNSDATLANTVGGIGTFTKTGTGNLTLANTNTFYGSTHVSAGTLTVDGSLEASRLFVERGATLTGTGIVGTTEIHSGGSLDTARNGTNAALRVQGNLSLEPGANYIAMIGENNESSKTHVSGAAVLNGGTLTLDVVGHPKLTRDTRYDLITASGGIFGRFNSNLNSRLESSYYFLAPNLKYDAQSVSLTMLRNTKTFASVANTRNEQAVGHALDTMNQNTIVNAVEELNARDARQSYSALSGEIHASARTNLVENSFYVRNAALERLQTAGCAHGVDQSTMKTASLSGPAETCGSTKATLWGAAYGSWGHNGGNGNAHGLHHSLGGFVLGGDAVAFETWRLGGLVSYAHSAFNANAINSSGHSNDISLGGYAGTHWGRVQLKLGAFYSWDMLSTNRTAAFSGYRDKLSSNYLGGTAQTFADLGYRFDLGQKNQIEPFMNVAYINVHTNGFHEHGGNAALNGRAMDTGTSYSTFGARAASSFKIAGTLLAVNGSLGYRHTYGLISPTMHQSFARGGSNFETAGALLARDAAVINAGTTARLTDRLDVGVSYVGQYGASYVDSGIRGKLSVKF